MRGDDLFLFTVTQHHGLVQKLIVKKFPARMEPGSFKRVCKSPLQVSIPSPMHPIHTLHTCFPETHFNSETAVFWDVAPCSLAEVDQGFRCTFCVLSKSRPPSCVFLLIVWLKNNLKFGMYLICRLLYWCSRFF